MLQLQSLAPDFTLVDQNEHPHTLSSYRGHYTLVYFYPKDDTPGCTKEACMIKEVYDDFKKLGVNVFGISTDSPKSHLKFAQKYELPFTLLSDPEKTVIKTYGAAKMIGTARISYLIDPEGIVIKVYPSVDPATHAETILKDIYGLTV